MSICQGKKTHFKQGKSGAFRALKFCHFLEQMEHFVTSSVWVHVCEAVWFTDFLYIYCLQLPRLFVKKTLWDFVVKASLMHSCVRDFFGAFTSMMCVYTVTTCVCVSVCARVALSQVSLCLCLLCRCMCRGGMPRGVVLTVH